MLRDYYRLALVTAVIVVVAAAHMFATLQFGLEETAPLYKGDSIGVAGTSGDEELTVGYSHPATLNTDGTGESSANAEAGVVQSTDPQSATSEDVSDYVHAGKPASSEINHSSNAKNSIPMPKDFKYEMPGSANVDLSTAHF